MLDCHVDAAHLIMFLFLVGEGGWGGERGSFFIRGYSTIHDFCISMPFVHVYTHTSSRVATFYCSKM